MHIQTQLLQERTAKDEPADGSGLPGLLRRAADRRGAGVRGLPDSVFLQTGLLILQTGSGNFGEIQHFFWKKLKFFQKLRENDTLKN